MTLRVISPIDADVHPSKYLLKDPAEPTPPCPLEGNLESVEDQIFCPKTALDELMFAAFLPDITKRANWIAEDAFLDEIYCF